MPVRYLSLISVGSSGRHGTSASGCCAHRGLRIGQQPGVRAEIDDSTELVEHLEPKGPRIGGRLADAHDGGVQSERIGSPADDPHYLVIELDFASVEQAAAFRDFLHSKVWVSPANAPALAGAPRTRILVPVES